MIHIIQYNLYYIYWSLVALQCFIPIIISISAHIYHSHYEAFNDLGLVRYLNMMTLHMVLFVEKFNLIEEKELLILSDLISELKRFKSSNDQLENDQKDAQT